MKRMPVKSLVLAAAILATSFRFAFTARRAQLDQAAKDQLGDLASGGQVDAVVNRADLLLLRPATATAPGTQLTAFVQPGGSTRDDEVIRAADARGVAMLLTGVRHFRH